MTLNLSSPSTALAAAAMAVLACGTALAAPGELLQTFENPNPSNRDDFGRALATFDGDLLVGSPFDETAGSSNSGTVYLFDGADASLLQTFTGTTGPRFDGNFGQSIAATPGSFLIGASEGGLFSGSATLYQGADDASPIRFGAPGQAPGSFSTTNNFATAAVGVGSNFAVSNSSGAGAVYLFDGSDASLLNTFTLPSSTRGVTLAARGTDVIAGAPNASGGGEAYLFAGGTDGGPATTFANPAGTGDFGSGVASVGSTVAVGDSETGAVYLFDGATGMLLLTIDNPTGSADLFGASVAEVNGDVLVGAPGANDAAGFNTGAAYLFDGDTGQLLVTYGNPDPTANSGFGRTVLGAGDSLFIAATGEFTNFGGAGNGGVVYEFDSVIPEPASLGLVLPAALGLLRRRR